MSLFGPLKKRFVAWVWNQTPNCAEMARLASQSFEQPVPPGVRLKMRLHYLVCEWCARYVKQLRFLHAAATRFDERAHLPAARGLSAEAKQRMVRRLRTEEE